MKEYSENVIDFNFDNRIETKQEGVKKVLDLSNIYIDNSDILKMRNDERFSVVLTKSLNVTGEEVDKDYIVDNGIPVFQVNEWLDIKNERRNTGKKYANILCRFLNYLNKRQMKYWDVSNNVIEDYIKYRLYGGENNVTLLRAKIRYKTIRDDVTVLTQFYKWLATRIKRIKIQFFKKEHYNNCAFLFAEIGATDYESVIVSQLESMEDSREYIKWYTEEQSKAIVSNLNKVRDKAIFLCTLDGGFRIDEVLSVKINEYDTNESTITPSRTKSKKIRTVKLSKYTCDMFDKYILGERADAEYESEKYSEYLFLNINKGKHQGEPMTYNNFLKILKKAAKKAGLPQEEIRTHSGRSSKAMEYLKVQARNPELNLTDTQIAISMGWESINSIKSYRDRKNEELAMMAQEKIQTAKRSKKDDK